MEAAPEHARRLSSALGFDCAIAASGQLWCWRMGGAPRPLVRFEHTRTLSGHASPGCAVLEDGTLACFELVEALGGPAVVFVDRARFAWTDVGAVEEVASPCVIRAEAHTLECLLPEPTAPAFFVGALGLTRGDRPPARVSLDGEARELAATSRQVCVVASDGGLSCFRPGHAPRPVRGLPPLRTVSMGASCGEIVCGLSRDDELLCFATTTTAGSVRIPEVRAVAVNGCTVCMASLDGRVACFGSAEDQAPFVSGPHLVPGLEHVVELSLGPDHGCARLEDERVVCFDPSGATAPTTISFTE